MRKATHGDRDAYRLFIGVTRGSRGSLFPKFDLLTSRVFIKGRAQIVILNLRLILDRYRCEL